MSEIKINNKEIGVSPETGDDFFNTKKDFTSNTVTEDEEISKNEIRAEEKGLSQSPLEISRTKYYESEKKKNDAKAKLFDGIRYAIYTIVGFGAIYGIIWAYKVNNIAEPIGGMKVEIKYINKDLESKKTQIEKNQERIEQLEKNFNTKKIQINETE